MKVKVSSIIVYSLVPSIIAEDKVVKEEKVQRFGTTTIRLQRKPKYYTRKSRGNEKSRNLKSKKSYYYDDYSSGGGGSSNSDVGIFGGDFLGDLLLVGAGTAAALGIAAAAGTAGLVAGAVISPIIFSTQTAPSPTAAGTFSVNSPTATLTAATPTQGTVSVTSPTAPSITVVGSTRDGSSSTMSKAEEMTNEESFVRVEPEVFMKALDEKLEASNATLAEKEALKKKILKKVKQDTINAAKNSTEIKGVEDGKDMTSRSGTTVQQSEKEEVDEEDIEKKKKALKLLLLKNAKDKRNRNRQRKEEETGTEG